MVYGTKVHEMYTWQHHSPESTNTMRVLSAVTVARAHLLACNHGA